MAEEQNTDVDVNERGLFGFMGNKDHGEVVVDGVEKLHIEEGEEKKKHGLLDKLHRSDSSSSSSDEEDKGENKEKKKKRGGLKEKVKEKFHGEAAATDEDTTIIVEKVEVTEESVGFLHNKPAEEGQLSMESTENHGKEKEGEKKGFLDKIKEKLPGYKNGGEGGDKSPTSH